MKKTLGALAVVAMITLLAPAPAQAQATGQTDIDITLPAIIVLHYFSTVSIDLDATALTGLAGNGGVDEGTSAPAETDFDQILGMTPSALPITPTAANLTLRNAWAVRAIVAVGDQVQLDITVDTATLSNGAAWMAIGVATVSSDGGTFSDPITFAAPGLATPEYGDVRLPLDLTSATLSGTYTGGQFTLTATAV